MEDTTKVVGQILGRHAQAGEDGITVHYIDALEEILGYMCEHNIRHQYIRMPAMSGIKAVCDEIISFVWEDSFLGTCSQTWYSRGVNKEPEFVVTIYVSAEQDKEEINDWVQSAIQDSDLCGVHIKNWYVEEHHD